MRMSSTILRWVILLSTSTMLTSACSWFVSTTQRNIEERAIEDELTFYVSRVPAILQCVAQPGGDCPSPAALDANAVALARGAGDKSRQLTALLAATPITRASIQKGLNERSRPGALSAATVSEADVTSATIAARALTNPTHAKLEALYHQISGTSTPGPPLALSRREVGAYAKSIQEATSLQGWEPLRHHLHGQLTELSGKGALQAQVLAVDSVVRHVTLVEAYVAAYFQNGNFVSLDIDPTNIEATAAAQLKAKLHVSDAIAREMVTKLVTQLLGAKADQDGKYHLLTKASDGGFVTRGGARYVFPGLTIGVDPASDSLITISKIDFTQVGADVVRVFLEALGDQLGQLPAAGTSTACQAKNAGRLDGYDKLRCYVEDNETVKATQFSKVNDYASQAESVAATATGQIIRGVSWLSLNNESLAKLIETAVGVIARKATEKVAWCVSACTSKTGVRSFTAGDEVSVITIGVGK